MMRVDELVATIPSLQRSDLEAWIRDALVAPEAETLLFSEMECARVRLICATAAVAAQDKEVQTAIIAAMGR